MSNGIELDTGTLVGVNVNGIPSYGYVTSIYQVEGARIAHVCLRPGHYTHVDLSDDSRNLRVI